MASQNYCDAVKKICEDYRLPIWKNIFGWAFAYSMGNFFNFCDRNKTFGIRSEIKDKEPITIPQFLEILNEK